MQRILSLAILGVALLFAGLPAFACDSGMSSGDCCRLGTQIPCRHGGPDVAAAQSTLERCCAAVTSVSTALVAVGRSTDIDKHPKRADPPAMAAAFAFGTSSHLPIFRSVAGFVTPTFSPSGSLLYLHTARLRL